MIDILVPVLRRPDRAFPLIESVRDSTSVQWELVFVVSEGDNVEMSAIVATSLHLGVRDKIRICQVPWQPGPGDYARKINHAFSETSSTWVFLGADDLRFHPLWDTAAIGCAQARQANVIGTDDLGNSQVRRGKHSTHSLIRRGYAEEFGLTWDGVPGMVYSDAYDHQYVDTELVSVAIDRGVFVFCKDSVVEHLHPLWGKGTMDDTYRKALEHGHADGLLFQRRRSELAGRDTA